MENVLEVDGLISPWEMDWLRDNACGSSVELGSHMGRSACSIGYGLMQTWGSLICIDLWGDPKVFEAFKQNTRLLGMPIHYIRMDSVKAASLFEDESLDFLFIDSSHTYEQTKMELMAWIPKVRKGGTISGHDYTNHLYPGIKQAIDELGIRVLNPTGGIFTFRK